MNRMKVELWQEPVKLSVQVPNKKQRLAIQVEFLSRSGRGKKEE